VCVLKKRERKKKKVQIIIIKEKRGDMYKKVFKRKKNQTKNKNKIK
jgi:hypothetical protein